MKSSMQLSSISNLFVERERELNSIIGNLQFDDVKTDPAINLTIKQIENKLLLQPVTIGDPKIAEHRTEVRNVPANYLNPIGGPQNFTIVIVDFPYTGSWELFEYRGGGSLTVNTIYSPTGNRISIEVRVSKLDKAEALAQANNEIRTTRELIEMNNPEIVKWSKGMQIRIKGAIESKAKELKEFYQ